MESEIGVLVTFRSSSEPFRPDPIEAIDRRRFLSALAGAVLVPSPRPAWRAGVAAVDITPRGPVWMAGYAARTCPPQGFALPLHAKALALEDERGTQAVLVALDILGVTAPLAARIAGEVRRRDGLPREGLLLNASHTHCGPVVDDMLSVAYDLTAGQWSAVREYSRELTRKVTAVIGDARRRLRPARLFFGEGEAGFAANRRVQFTPDGPVDHSVPVLRVDGHDGQTLALAFGYACHNTTLHADYCRFHGDYAGVAQAALEKRHPGARALFVAGCGGDANPKPRGTLDLAERHGTALADAVERVKLTPLSGPLRVAYGVVDLPFAPAPGRAEWEARSRTDDRYVGRHARLMLEILDRDGRLPSAQPEPVQVWRFGRDLTLVALGGEVVVDYALRLKKEHARERLWVAAYSNDVFGYVPSRRVLEEGGYEGGGAMLYYGKPGPFAPEVEELIHREVRRLMEGGGP
jgi:hypothetical protein